MRRNPRPARRRAKNGGFGGCRRDSLYETRPGYCADLRVEKERRRR
jgi:hypothetical protein